MCAPMPKPLSRIQLDCTRLFAPPTPAKASAPSTSGISRPAAQIASVTIFGASEYASPVIAATSATARKTSTAATLTNSTFSSVL